MLQIGTAVFESGKQDSSGDGSAGTFHTAHTKPEGFCGFEHGFFVNTDEVAVGSGNGLAAVKIFIMIGKCFGNSVRHNLSSF